ncbi:hypothetical protein [Heyndrickxia oleronia]|uniref:hypothetical protein n=1 Tax=Heyndrickxia oleronia TaxID=38875 RepID=UPI003F83926C
MKKWIKFIYEDKTLLIDMLFILICMFATYYIFNSYTLAEIWRTIVKWNSNWKWTDYWYGMIALYWIEVILVVFIWDIFWFRLYYVSNIFYTELTQYLVKKKKLLLLVKLIRFQYGLNKFSYYMRFGWISYSTNSKRDLKDLIVSLTLFEFVKIISNSLFRFPTILALLLTLTNYMTEDIQLRNKYEQLLYKAFLFFSTQYTKLSALVVLVLILFIWYFVSGKGVIRRTVAQANRKKLEDIIQVHRQLTNLIMEMIMKGAENLEYTFKCRESILDYWTNKRYPLVSESNFKNIKLLRYGLTDVDEFKFLDIPEINKTVDEFSKLLSAENRNMSLWFSKYDYELVKVLTRFKITKAEYYEEYLFTRSGFDRLFDIKKSNFIEELDSTNEKVRKIQESRDFFERYVLNKNIIEGIELLYELYRYIHALNRLLHVDSDKIGRALRMFTGKE